MGGAQTYAGLGIPGPAPCPCWCEGSHAGSCARPGRAVIFHEGSVTGGSVLAGGQPVSVVMTWAERFAGGAWQPWRGEDVIVFVQAGTGYLAIEATDPNMARLAAIAWLISPDAGGQAGQLTRLMGRAGSARYSPQVTRCTS